MKLGICGYLTGKNTDGYEFDLPRAARQAGFDYIEMPLATIAALDDAAFEEMRSRVAHTGLPCEVCNVLFPGSLRLTGDVVPVEEIDAYLAKALQRAARLGVQVVVFGSGTARNVPVGFPMEQAWLQLTAMLRRAGELAAEHGIALAIEPLNRQECNILHTAAEGFTLAKLVNHPQVGLLIDSYHMAKEGEDPGIAVTARRYLRHIHVAAAEGRTFPVEGDECLHSFFAALRRSGYAGRVSVEAGYSNFMADASRTLATLRALI